MGGKCGNCLSVSGNASRLVEIASRLAEIESGLVEIGSGLVEIESRLVEIGSRLEEIESRLVEIRSRLETIQFGQLKCGIFEKAPILGNLWHICHLTNGSSRLTEGSLRRTRAERKGVTGL